MIFAHKLLYDPASPKSMPDCTLFKTHVRISWGFQDRMPHDANGRRKGLC
jgi:hypothetical protein